LTVKTTASHRARVSIVQQVLIAVSKYPSDGIPSYRLQCEASLSHNQIREYVQFMVDNGLLLVTQDNRKLHKGQPRVIYWEASRQYNQRLSMKIGTESWGRTKDNRDSSKERQAAVKEHTPSVQAFRQIENTILLNERAMEMLRMIAVENGKTIYLDLVIYLAKFYRDSTSKGYDFQELH
jgi:predicted transcriptional regulator